MHEKQLWTDNAFITLTYEDPHLPPSKSLRYSDYQGFMKKLLRHVGRADLKSKTEPTKCTPPFTWGATENRGNKFPLTAKGNRTVRFYMCGEYGSQTRRPHYHAILFGYDFHDKKRWKKTASGETLYTSDQLTKIWGKGHATTGEVTFNSAAYVARYIMKKITGNRQKKHYEEIDMETGEILTLTPEFNHMSLKPGIGAPWLERYAADVYPEGTLVVRGHQSKSPKYYDKKFKVMSPLEYEDLQHHREIQALSRSSDNTKERLADKEKVTLARIKSLKRTLE